VSADSRRESCRLSTSVLSIGCRSWQYPPTGSIGPVKLALTGGCWGVLADDCNRAAGTLCVELLDSCGDADPPVMQWNVSSLNNDSVTFIAVNNTPPGAAGMCVDFNNGPKRLLELYACKPPDSAGNQEWIEVANGGLQEVAGDHGCLCLDSRSRTPSASASSSVSLSASQSQSASLFFTFSSTSTPSPSHAPLPQQRITSCPCDGSAEQAWLYDLGSSVGPVFNKATQQCWSIVTDNCAVLDDDGFSACVELRVRN
jgi:hypothetical protein